MHKFIMRYKYFLSVSDFLIGSFKKFLYKELYGDHVCVCVCLCGAIVLYLWKKIVLYLWKKILRNKNCKLVSMSNSMIYCLLISNSSFILNVFIHFTPWMLPHLHLLPFPSLLRLEAPFTSWITSTLALSSLWRTWCILFHWGQIRLPS